MQFWKFILWWMELGRREKCENNNTSTSTQPWWIAQNFRWVSAGPLMRNHRQRWKLRPALERGQPHSWNVRDRKGRRDGRASPESWRNQQKMNLKRPGWCRKTVCQSRWKLLSEDCVSGMAPRIINRSDEFWSNIYATQVLWYLTPHPPQPLFLPAVILLWSAKSSFI